MRKTVIGFALLAMVLASFCPNPVMGQEVEKEASNKWFIHGGMGAAAPLRNEAFTTNAEPGFYRVLSLEYQPGENDRIRLFGRWNRSTMDAIVGPEYDNTTIGAGILLYFDLVPGNNIRGAFKLGGSRVTGGTATVPDPQWEPELGFLAEGHFNGNASIRIGVDMITFRNDDRLSALNISVGIVAAIDGIWPGNK